MWSYVEKAAHSDLGSDIRNFVLVELVAGTGIYYVVKFVFSSIMLGMVGSIVSVEGIKRFQKRIRIGKECF